MGDGQGRVGHLEVGGEAPPGELLMEAGMALSSAAKPLCDLTRTPALSGRLHLHSFCTHEAPRLLLEAFGC